MVQLHLKQKCKFDLPAATSPISGIVAEKTKCPPSSIWKSTFLMWMCSLMRLPPNEVIAVISSSSDDIVTSSPSSSVHKSSFVFNIYMLPMLPVQNGGRLNNYSFCLK